MSFDGSSKTNAMWSQVICSLLGKRLDFGEKVEFNVIDRQRRLGSRHLSRELFISLFLRSKQNIDIQFRIPA